MRHSRRAWVGAILTLVLLSVAEPSGAVGSPFPAYVDGYGDWTIGSNGHWAADGEAVKILRPLNLGANPLGGETQSALWSTTCSRGTQTLDLTRDVQVPGPPSSLTFTLETLTSTGVSTGAGIFPSLQSLRLIVNGSTVLAVNASSVGQYGGRALNQGNSNTFTLGSTARSYFHDGSNALRVVVVKNPSPARAPACNRPSSPVVIGVSFALQGASQADLSVTAGKSRARYLKIRPGQQLQVLDGTFKVHNNGPSAEIVGEFYFSIDLGFEKLTELGSAEVRTAPLEKCTHTLVNGRYSIDCPFSDFRPGATATIRVTLGIDVSGLTAQGGYDSVDASWGVNTGNASITGVRDPIQGNNSWSEEFYLCGPSATAANPNCATATNGVAGA